MYALGYTIHIIISKTAMTQLVQTWNLKLVSDSELPMHLKLKKLITKVIKNNPTDKRSEK
jgi:hypothetical protein